MQWNAYWPGSVGAVSVPCPLPSTSTSNLPAVSDVTECSAESLFLTATWAPGDTVMGSPKLMFSIVIVAAPVAAGPLVGSAVPVGLAVIVAVPVFCSGVEVLDPPHAVANAATRHTATQNKPNLFILTPLDWTLAKDTIIDPNWFKEDQFRGMNGRARDFRVAAGWQPDTVDGVVACDIRLVGQRIMALQRCGCFAKAGPGLVCGPCSQAMEGGVDFGSALAEASNCESTREFIASNLRRAGAGGVLSCAHAEVDPCPRPVAGLRQ